MIHHQIHHFYDKSLAIGLVIEKAVDLVLKILDILEHILLSHFPATGQFMKSYAYLSLFLFLSFFSNFMLLGLTIDLKVYFFLEKVEFVPNLLPYSSKIHSQSFFLPLPAEFWISD